MSWLIIGVGSLALITLALTWLLPDYVVSVVNGLAAGVLIGIAFWEAAWLRRDAKTRKLTDHLPLNINANVDDDGKVTAIVERRNGELVSIELPEGYDPREDNGLGIMQQVMTPEELEHFMINFEGLGEDGL